MSMFYNDVQMDDGSVNSQEYKSFWNLCSHYQDIYDWISPINI